jgi:FAD:protein FMN transferase
MVNKYRATFCGLGCNCEIQLYSESTEEAKFLIGKCIEIIDRIDQKYSRYKPDSIISKINSLAGIKSVEVDSETSELLNLAYRVYLQSDGLFDITSGVLRKAWDFTNGKIPSDIELAKFLPLIGLDKVIWNEPNIFLPKTGMELDFGGFGKEYAVDKVVDALLNLGVKHGQVNLGGDIRLIGPHADGTPWQIGISHPERPSTPFIVHPLSFGALATSGDYERYFIRNGKRFSHLLNPKTGRPVSGLRSATIVADTCLIAGVTATLSLLMGDVKSIDLLNSIGINYILVNEELRVFSNCA